MFHFKLKDIFKTMIRHVVPEKELRCKSPEVSDEIVESYRVSVVLEYQGRFYDTSSRDNDSITFFYHEDISLKELFPAAMQLSGRSQIHVYGSNFLKSKELKCSFRTLGKEVVVPARFHDSNRLSCNVPDYSMYYRKTTPLSAVIKVSLNGVDFSENQLQLWLHNNSSVLTVQPDTGFEFGGKS